MADKLDAQMAELQRVHTGLKEITVKDNETVLSGTLPFEASANDYSPVSDIFNIELIIPDTYPENLPRVRETDGRIIQSGYEHVYQDGTLCLAVPIEERRIFAEQPTLLGFVNRLVIPYLFGFCHWQVSGEHPFGEQEHGAEGIVQHYVDSLCLQDEMAALSVIAYLAEYGYRGHHPCPCGSGKNVRSCHGKMLRELHEQHNDRTIRYDFLSVLNVCLKGMEAQRLQIPQALLLQIRRILKKKKY